jgi:hypothetical protein
VFVLVCGLLLAGVVLFVGGLLAGGELLHETVSVGFFALLVGLFMLVVVWGLMSSNTVEPSAMEITTEGVAMVYPRRSRLRPRMLRYDEIEEIAPAHPGVVVRSRFKSFYLFSPRGGCLAAYDVLVSAWQAAREGKEQAS